MNDDLIILNAYANTNEKESILKNCISQFKKTNKEILLVSHYPVDIEIQQLVDYFIYDKRNEMLDTSMLTWYSNGEFYAQSLAGDLGSYSYAVLLSIQNAICFAKNLGKKLIYYFEGDCFISDSDLNRIDLLKNEIYKKDKKGYIRLDKHGVDIKNKGVTTLFFMIEVDFFLENCNIMKSSDEYKKNVKHSIALEFYLYQALFKNISHLEVVESDYIKDNFPNSNFNLSSVEAPHLIDVLPEQETRNPILVIINPKQLVKHYKILFLENNGNSIREYKTKVINGAYHYNILSEKVKKIKIFYKENDEWKLVYDKMPHIEVDNKKDFEYARLS